MEQQLLNILNEMMEENDFPLISTLKAELKLKEDLNMDSLMLAELTVKLEAEFDVDIFEDGIIQTVGEVIKKLEEK